MACANAAPPRQAAETYAAALLKAASNISEPVVLRFALTLIEDLLECEFLPGAAAAWLRSAVLTARVTDKTSQRVALFVQGDTLQTAPFLRLLATSSDAYVQYKAARSLAYLLS